MKKRKVLITGGGIAGLPAGSYLVRNGYDTEIFEAHTRPGGVCTSWKRGDYKFDYCIHWLVGTGSGTGFSWFRGGERSFRPSPCTDHKA